MTRWICCITILFTVYYIDIFNISIFCFWHCCWNTKHLTMIIYNLCSNLISKSLTMCTNMGSWVLVMCLDICTMTWVVLRCGYINILTLLIIDNIVTKTCPPPDVG
jgi:hypothetical protein